MNKHVQFSIDSMLMSYARIFFAENRLLGAIVLVATMNTPLLGFFGLLGGIASSLVASLIGMDRDSIRKGVYGLNGILSGLGIGYYFEPSPPMLVVLVLVAIMLTFVTILLNTLLYQLCALPAMSMPFNLATWLIVAGGAGIGGLQPGGAHLQIFALPEGLISGWPGAFLSSLGVVFFQPDHVTGLILVIGLVIWSRIALLLLLAGFTTSFVLQSFLGIDAVAIGGDALTFNQMFAALAIGGIFTVPGPGSLLLAIITSASALLFLVGVSAIFPANLSPLALPFNLAVMLTLYTLRSRLHPSFDLQLAPVPPGSPEENLSRCRENLRVWKRWGVALSLPYRGRWKVAQGVDGDLTHQGDWRFAFDFQAVAADGTIYCNSGRSPDDYYSWGASVHAPAAGTVHSVIDGIPDNEIGTINGEQNWGNCIIIYHAENYYSCLAHLKEGSISVKPGDLLARGEQVALCGNSGRSPYPHLHFQMQMSPLPGAPGMAFSFENFTAVRDGQESFISKGELVEGDVVFNATPCADYGHFFPYTTGGGWTFLVTSDGREEREMWEAGVDFYGNTYIASYPKKTRLYFLLQDGVLTVKKLEGSRESGLFLFGSMIAELPFIDADTVAWTSLESADYALWPLFSRLFDIFSLVGTTLRHQIDAQLVKVPEGLKVTTVSQIIMETAFGTIPIRRQPDGELVFSKQGGMMHVQSGKRRLVKAPSL
jgi:urea transporter/murein DD-endopeptidase MepM/ murein hydrolase activator NlpD